MVETSWEKRGVLRRFIGLVSAEEARDSILDVHADPRFDGVHYVINDFTACDLLAHDHIAIDELVARARAATQGKHFFVGILVGDHPLLKKICATWTSLAIAEHACHVFSSMEAARLYLAAKKI